MDTPQLLTHIVGPLIKWRIIGGHDVPSVLETGRRYIARGYRVSYDLMLEDLEDFQDVRRARKSVQELLYTMDQSNEGNIVIKPSMFGLSIKTEDLAVADHLYEKNVADLLRAVYFQSQGRAGVEVDAESSRELHRKLAVINELRKTLPIGWTKKLRVAVQMHLADTTKHAEEYKLFEYPVRIVKGAGVYKEDPALVVDKNEIGRRALQYAHEAFCNDERPYIATVRDRKYIRGLLRDLHCLGAEKDQFEIQLLHGIGWNLARELHDEGYVVRIYIPFVMPWCKDAWKPYVARRITTLATAWFDEYAKYFRSEDAP